MKLSGLALALYEFERRLAIAESGGDPDVMPLEAWEKVKRETLRRMKRESVLAE